MNEYQKRKARAREKAIDYQNSFSEGKIYYYSEIAFYTSYFKKLAKRYGLIKEFTENGII